MPLIIVLRLAIVLARYQIMPAAKNAIMASFLTGQPTLLEPILKIDVKVPQEWLSGVLNVITRHRGRIVGMEQHGLIMRVFGEIPVSESFNLADEMRTATQGRAFWAYQFSHWAPVPQNLLESLVMEIRKRKGLPPRIPKPEDYCPKF